MKVISIAVCRYEDSMPEVCVLSNAHEVSSFGFFERGACVLLFSATKFVLNFVCFYRVREMCTFFTRTFIKRTPSGSRQAVEHEGSSIVV